MIRRDHARHRPAEGVPDQHERSVADVTEGGQHQIGVVASAARTGRLGRRAESGEIKGHRGDAAQRQRLRRGGEIRTPTGPAVEPDDPDWTFAVRLTENGSIAVGTQHV
jgi:hypothetical protein